MATPERNAREQETLIFNTAEKAREFAERVEKRAADENGEGVNRPKEIVGEEVVKEIEREGEESVDLTQPWEHTKEEHEEVQQLVDTAFREDLPLALKKARQSDNYPRLIDLFHDVLTGQMYETLVQNKVNQHKSANWQWAIIALAALLVLAGLIILLVF